MAGSCMSVCITLLPQEATWNAWIDGTLLLSGSGRTLCSNAPAVLQEAYLSLRRLLDPQRGGISCQDEEVGLKFLY